MGAALHARAVVGAFPAPTADGPQATTEAGPAVSESFGKALKEDKVNEPVTLAQPLGLLVPDSWFSAPKDPSIADAAVDGKLFLTLADRSTVVPFRRVFDLPLASTAAGKVVLDLWQGEPDVKVEAPPTKAPNGKKSGYESEEDSEDEEEPRRISIVKPTSAIAHLDLTDLVAGAKSGKTKTVSLELTVEEDGKGSWSAKGEDGKEVKAAF